MVGTPSIPDPKRRRSWQVVYCGTSLRWAPPRSSWRRPSRWPSAVTYPAQVLLIDGETPKSFENGFKITPGQHTVKVAEMIPEGELGISGIPNNRDTEKRVTMDYNAVQAEERA